jgi:hypothetical protein
VEVEAADVRKKTQVEVSGRSVPLRVVGDGEPRLGHWGQPKLWEVLGEDQGRVIRLKRIYNFLCSMLLL